MSTILITYHSFTGKTKELAEAAAAGAGSAGAQTVLKEAAATTVEDLKNVDTLLVATPQTFGSMAAETKKLFERLWQEKDQITPGMPLGAIVLHLTDPGTTLEFLGNVGAGLGFVKTGEWLSVKVAELEAGKERSHQLGATLAETGRTV